MRKQFLRCFIFVFLFGMMGPLTGFAQNTVDVLFRYTPGENAVRSFVPGSFNNWGNNSSGVIQPSDGSLLTPDPEAGYSYKILQLTIGGGGTSHQGKTGYTYKFHEHLNSSGTSYNWVSDPINPITVGNFNDSFVEVTHPMIFQTVPKEGAVISVTPPDIISFVGARSDDPIDTSTSKVILNGSELGSFADYYDNERQMVTIPSAQVGSVNLLNEGTNSLTIMAVSQSDEISEQTTTFTFVQPSVVDEPRPAGVEDGITYSEENPGSITFSLFAPGKEFVHVIGDHSDWQVNDNFLMKRDVIREDSVHFWLTVDGFTEGETYRFQYVVDGSIRITDPFSELILDPFHDSWIPTGRFPNMPDYPEGLTNGLVGILEPGKQPYEWQVPEFERPAVEKLVIYELLLRDFLEESSYDVLTDTLDYLETLGINAIELMPVAEFDGNNNWGYSPMVHGALDKYYGSPEAFKRFVDAAHQRGIAVLLDVVYNHAHERSPLIELYGANRSANRFIGPGHAFNVFQHLNHGDPYIRYWLDRMNRYWLEEYNIDGYRFDLTKGFATNVDDDGNLQGPNPERIQNLKRMYSKIREYDDTAIIILEHFADNFEEQQLEQAGMLLWGNHNFNYSEAAMGYHDNGRSDFSRIYYANRGFTNPHLVGYMESHDEQWIMRKMKNYGNQSNTNHDIRNLDVALNRQKLNGAFFFTIPGPKMLWQFGELGYGWGDLECLRPSYSDETGDCLETDPSRTAEKPIRWQYANQENRRQLYETWADLLHLRSSSPVFSSSDTQFSSFLSGNTKWIKLQHSDMDAVIIGNFDVIPRDRAISFTQPGTWYDYFEESSFDVSEDQLQFTYELEPGEFKIFTSEFVDPIFTSTEGPSIPAEIPSQVYLYPSYPNPFNPATTIHYSLTSPMNVSVTIHDLLGREVLMVQETTFQASGEYRIDMDASSLGSGVYLLRLQTGAGVQTQKITLIK